MDDKALKMKRISIEERDTPTHMVLMVLGVTRKADYHSPPVGSEVAAIRYLRACRACAISLLANEARDDLLIREREAAYDECVAARKAACG